jgi:hypothetical protein
VNYTKEPWVVSYGYADNGAGFVSIVSSSSGESIVGEYGLTEEDARRIVACVNACHGISTESLERFDLEHKPTNGFGLHRESKLEAQRDELLAALKEAEKTLAHCKADIGYRHRQTEAAIMINRVIAKCEAQS